MYTVAKDKGLGCQKVNAKDYLDAITLYYDVLNNDAHMSITDVKGISCHLVNKFKNFYVGDVGYCISKLYEFIRSAIYRDIEVYDYLCGNNEFINVDFTLINCVHEKSIKGIVNLLIRCKRLLRLLGERANKGDTITYLRRNNFLSKFVVCGVSSINLSPFEDILYIVTFNGKKWISIEDVMTNIKCMISYICSDNRNELRALYDVIREDTSYLQIENTLTAVSFDTDCSDDCYVYEIDDVFFRCELEHIECVGDLQDLFYVLHFATRYLHEDDRLITLGDIAGYMLSHAYLSRVGCMSILNDSSVLDSVEQTMITEWCLHGDFIGDSCMPIHQSYCVSVLNTFNGYLTNESIVRLHRLLNVLDTHRSDITVSDGSIVIDGYVFGFGAYIQPTYLDTIVGVYEEIVTLHKIREVLQMYSMLWNTTVIPLNVVEVFKCLSCMSDDTLTCGFMLDVDGSGIVYVRDIDEDSLVYTHSHSLQHMFDYSGVKTYKDVKESNMVMHYVKDNIKNYIDSLRLLISGFKEVCSYKGIDKVFLDCESQQIDCFGYMIALHNGKNRRVIIDCPNLSSTIYHMCMDCFHEGFTENSLYEMLVALNRLYGYLNDALANVGLRDEYYEVLKDISHDLFVVEEMFNKVMGHSKCVNHKADNVSKQLVQDFIDNGYVLVVKDGDDIVVYTEDKSQSEVVPKSLHKYFYNIDSIDMLPLVYYVYHCEG